MARDDDDDRPRRRRPADADGDDRPRKRRVVDEDEDDDRPRKRRVADEDEDDDRPRKRRVVDEDEDDDRPRKRRRDEDDDDRPRKKKKKGGKGLLIGLIVGGSVLVIGLVVVLIIVLSGGDSHEKVMRDLIRFMNRASEVLETVKDDSSATAAGAKLKQMAQEGQDLKRRGDALGVPSAEEQQRLMMSIGPELGIAMSRFMAAGQSAQALARNNPALREAMRELSKVTR